MSEPEDPITQLAQSAAATHELFSAYIETGFTEPQALYLTAQLMTASMRGPTG